MKTGVSAAVGGMSVIIIVGILQANEGVMGKQDFGRKGSIQQVKSDHEMELMNIEGVQGVGIGLDNEKDQEVIKVYVDKKTTAVQEKIPAELEGFPVSIEVSGELRAF